MKNFELNSYRENLICDGHIHPHVKLALKDSAEIFKRVLNHFNYQNFAIQALPSYSVTNNLEGKPDYRKRLGKPLDHPSFGAFFLCFRRLRLRCEFYGKMGKCMLRYYPRN